jgi:hypothetical protein
MFEKCTDFYRTLRNNKKQETPFVEAVLHTSDDCLFITEDHGKPREAMFIIVGRNLSCCTGEEEKTDCREGTLDGDPLFVNIC